MNSPFSAEVQIPTRFESVLARSDLQAAPLILPVEDDLRLFLRLRRLATVQNGGLLAFLVGPSGVGKTTAVYSVVTHVPDEFASVLPAPPELPLRDLASWLLDNLPSQAPRTTLLLLDGREVTDDAVGLSQFIASLNQILRGRPDVVVIWPTTDAEWHYQLRSVSQRIGGGSLSPTEADVSIAGPPRSAWPEALDRILMQLDKSLDDLAIQRDTLETVAASSTSIGDFLRQVAVLIVDRVEDVQIAHVLPSLLFVMTSTSEVVGEANRIRRAGTFLLKAEELVNYSPRSTAGLWWKHRGADARHHLGYIITLFNARLATMGPSAVMYACGEFDDDLRQIVRDSGGKRSSSNADRTLRSTDLYRYLIGEASTELTSTRKGRTAQTTLDAFAAIQAVSTTKHLAINRAICRMLDRNIPDFDLDGAAFEVDQGAGEVFTDAVVPTNSGDLYLEFHHASEARAAAMAAYIMGKLQRYAIRYNLVPR